MDFSTFETTFLMQLKMKNKECLSTIENNKKLIENNLGNNGNPEILEKFVNGIINIVIDIGKNSLLYNKDNFKLIENVLSHPYFNKVLDRFNNSKVLVRACQVGNKNAAKWLMTMNISPYIQDENGMSAQMYAAQQGFYFVIKPLLNDTLCMNLEDRNGENVLFHALRNPKFITEEANESNFNKFPSELINSSVDINHINNNGESVLNYCVKNDIFKPINQYLLRNPKIDVNIADNDEITPVMYLAEKGRYYEFSNLHRRNCNYDYINMKGQSALSIVMQKIYAPSKGISYELYDFYVSILDVLVYYQCDCNIPIDNDENTAFMVSLIAGDIYIPLYIAMRFKKLDLSIKNKYGENGTSICFKLGYYKKLFPIIKDNPTFDYQYRDPINQNTLLMISAINNPSVMKELLENDPSIINEVNNKGENALIIASKINHIESVKILLKQGINVNQQDCLGNTALHYAVDIQKPYLVKLLVSKKINIHLKNNNGKSALDMAQDLKNSSLIDLMTATDSNIHLDSKKSKNELDIDVESKYYEEIQKYLTPYANNYYPNFDPSFMKNTRQVLYKRSKDDSKDGIKDLMIAFLPVPTLPVLAVKALYKKYKTQKE